ncbi:hypothetical protein [Alkalibaculum bacchi]|uniref:hypothetical protein n=1 Tax=Alkalibaculum bacchi TaxID=645887 RepID=UPI0026F1F3DF|nr:hypothetical protein [Alkalibaculum bacchi]MCI1934025.1 hypothetical protein [Atopobiaceae bacterium]
MSKTYVYEPPFFSFEVTFIGFFCAVICILSLIFSLIGLYLSKGIWIMASIVSFYQVWNTFISHSNPEKITIDENEISFYCYRKTTKYKFININSFKLREFPSSGKIYLRINNATIFHGRYWVPTKMFNDSEELFRTLQNIEYQIHPDTLKARARRVNEEYIEHADEIKALRNKKRKQKINKN